MGDCGDCGGSGYNNSYGSGRRDVLSQFGGGMTNLSCLWICSDVTKSCDRRCGDDVDKDNQSVNKAAPVEIEMSREFELKF